MKGKIYMTDGKCVLKPFEGEKKIKALKIFALAFICFAGIAFCFLYAENYGKMDEVYTPDEGHYIKMAQNLLSGKFYSYWGETADAYVTPGFPMFLVACMSVLGTGLKAIHTIKLIQAVIFGITVFLVFLLAFMLTKKYSVSIIAAALVCVNPMNHYYSRYLLTETLFVFTMMLFFVSAVYAWKKDKWFGYLFAGITLCVAVMVRPLLIVVLPVIVVIDICKKWGEWRAFAFSSGLFIIGFVIVGLPWWIRNLVTMKQFILLATQTNPIYAGLAKNVEELGLTDPGTMFGNLKLLFTLLIKRPVQTIYWMTLGKFYNIFLIPCEWPYASVYANCINIFTVILGLSGCVRALFTKRLRVPTIIFFIYLLSAFMFIPVQRYSLAYLPVLAIGVGYLMYIVFNKNSIKEDNEESL